MSRVYVSYNNPREVRRSSKQIPIDETYDRLSGNNAYSVVESTDQNISEIVTNFLDNQNDTSNDLLISNQNISATNLELALLEVLEKCR